MENRKLKVRLLRAVLLATALAAGPASSAYAAKETAESEHTETTEVVKEFEATNVEEEALRQFERSIQKDGKTFILDKIETEILSEKPQETALYLYETPVFTDKNGYQAEGSLEHDGKTYVLQEKKLVEAIADERTKYAEAKVAYEAVEWPGELPNVSPVTVTDENTGQEITAMLPEKRTEKGKTYWISDFAFPIQITGYETDSFLLGDVEIPREAELIDYSSEFLTFLGLPSEYYRITSIEWDGEPEEKDGTQVRTATARGDKLVYDAEVTYGGEVKLPKVKGYRYQCRYVADDPNSTVLYMVQATATYKELPRILPGELSWLEAFGKWVTENIVIVSIALLLLLALAVVMIFIIGRPRKSPQEEEMSFQDRPVREQGIRKRILGKKER